MGNLIFGTTTVQGRTFDDIKIQTSKAGVPRPIVFGTARPIVGNIIATTEPRIETSTEEQGGKGGPSVEVENEEVFRTFAIRICEGPVTGVRRVWRNNELVFVDGVEDYVDETYGFLPPILRNIIINRIEENNTAFLQNTEFFLGSYTQAPSAVMQAAFGIDNVPAHRGTCYMVVDDDNLTNSGGAIPQYAFEVQRCEGFSLTSRPYDVEVSEAMASDFSNVKAPPSVLEVDNVLSEFSGISGTLKTVFQSYENYDPEAIDASFESITGDLYQPLATYENYDPEAIDASFESITGELTEVIIFYENYDPEAIDASFESITGDLT